MNHPNRAIAILTLLLLVAFGVLAQQTEPAPAAAAPQEAQTETAAPATAAATTPETADPSRTPPVIRDQFGQLIDRHPPELARVLALDPSLLSNEPFLARYPELAQFVAENPEVRSNPHYFVRQYESVAPQRPSGPFEEVIEALSIAFVFGLIAFALAWLVRTIIEQKRWNKLSRTQAEVHNKILDRFASSEELLAYIKTPAGSKFLESAPIPLRIEPVRELNPPNAPLGRAMRSISIGVVVAAAGLGLFLVSMRFEQEAARELFAMGVIAFFIGAGFIGSAALSIVLSRRLGLWESEGAPRAEHLGDPGVMR